MNRLTIANCDQLDWSTAVKGQVEEVLKEEGATKDRLQISSSAKRQQETTIKRRIYS